MRIVRQVWYCRACWRQWSVEAAAYPPRRSTDHCPTCHSADLSWMVDEGDDGAVDDEEEWAEQARVVDWSWHGWEQLPIKPPSRDLCDSPALFVLNAYKPFPSGRVHRWQTGWNTFDEAKRAISKQRFRGYRRWEIYGPPDARQRRCVLLQGAVSPSGDEAA